MIKIKTSFNFTAVIMSVALFDIHGQHSCAYPVHLPHQEAKAKTNERQHEWEARNPIVPELQIVAVVFQLAHQDRRQHQA